jgi:signal transduction histidine kinase
LAEATGAEPASLSLRALLLRDPGALVAFLASSFPSANSIEWSLLDLPNCETATRLWSALDRTASAGFADWSRPLAAQSFRMSQCAARLARWLATQCSVAVDAAEIAGLLSLLGWLVSGAQGHAKVSASEAAALTRRLAREWPLPAWLANTLLSLDLSAPLSGALAIEPKFLWAVQAALGLAQEHMATPLSVPIGNSPDEAFARLGLAIPSREVVQELLANLPSPPGSATADVAPLIWRLARLAMARRSKLDMPAAGKLEVEAEQLREQLATAQHSEYERLRDMKLRALAEFAAGAGHEINNPLAVISGQAQHLLKTEENLDRAHCLERIMTQCRRIHNLLRDVMLYARPPQPRRRTFALAKVVAGVLAELADYALERRVALENVVAQPRLRIHGDPDLVRTALTCLVRNAIEAAPTEGWARVRVEPHGNRVSLVVEDNGPGLSPIQREHSFDPFFSYRTAGRGAGLGLSKAWRVAQLHHGTLEAHSEPGQPTRFALTLPLREIAAAPIRQSAAARRSRRKNNRRTR